jgi:renalase
MKNTAVIGAGMAGITAARTLLKAGHRVTVFEKSHGAGGRMSSRNTPYGSFDHGTQYFTVRNPDFLLALTEVPGTQAVCRAWSANAVRVLDPLGRVIEAALAHREPHFVASPGMNALVRHWALPLEEAKCVHYQTQVQFLKRNAKGWELVNADKGAKHGGFDNLVLAIPHVQADFLLRQSSAPAASFKGLKALSEVQVAPCWTLMLAYPLVNQSGLSHIGATVERGPQRAPPHRLVVSGVIQAGRGSVERWTVQASADWSQEHLEDDEERVQAKLLKAFAELTGIRAEPGYAQVHRWRYAKTLQPLGQNHLWDASLKLGLCGDWLLGHRVEDAFVSGLGLSLAMLD